MIKIDPQKRRIDIGVHDLIEAGAQTGDLHLQLAWRAKTRMKEGQKIHLEYQTLRAKQDANFRAEVLVRYEMVYRDWEIRVSGRMDGYTQEGDLLVIEEIKSSTLPQTQLLELKKSQIRSWISQLELYLHFLLAQGKEAVGRLVVISVLDRSEKLFSILPNPLTEEYIQNQVAWIVEQHEQRQAWIRTRTRALEQGVPFPHERFREGQQELIETMLPHLQAGKHIFLSAPTGSGKTAAALYASIKHAYENNLRVFFATARTTQQLMAEETVERMAKKGIPIRAVSIRAKEKICLHHEVRCSPDVCPYAAGYFDKLQRNNTLQTSWNMFESRGELWPERIIRIAEEQYICPHALSIDLAGMADVVIGDFNYVFDPSVRLSMVSSEPQKWMVIVDEAHNLPERAMGYGSPRISLRLVWRALEGTRGTDFAQPLEELYSYLLDQLSEYKEKEWSFDIADVSAKVFHKWVNAFENLAVRYAQVTQEQSFFSEEDGDLWTDVARTIFRFSAIFSQAKEETLVLYTKGYLDRKLRRSKQPALFSLWKPKDENTSLALLNRDPSGILGPVFTDFHSSIIMSATLEPMEYYRNMFGIPQKHRVEVRAPSYFPQEHRASFVIPSISTAYRDRERDREKTAIIIGDIISNTPGNIAVFFSSFAYLEQVVPLIDCTGEKILQQRRGLSESERKQLLETMRKGEGHTLFAVMGGIFSEGVDLPDKALRCAVMVGPCLPHANYARRKIQEWNEKKYRKGFAYAWLVPGMARVSQAAGRVIRTPTDKGTIILLGKRFASRNMQDFLPKELILQTTYNIKPELQSFWKAHSEN